MESIDKRFLEEVIERIQKFVSEKIGNDNKVQNPIDDEIMSILYSINLNDEEEFGIFRHIDCIMNLWKTLIKKSIICLRYFDKREPFKDVENKKPIAYGVDELYSYFLQYAEFEKLLYGGVKFYRDHVVHVFRVWMLGVDILLNPNDNYLDKMVIEKGFETNPLEKLSIWTIISLTHDLGYPLEKSIQIIDQTKSMMHSFVQNPVVTMDTSYSGVQNSMNDYVLKFISSKMIEINPENLHEKIKFNDEEYKKALQEGRLDKYIENRKYVARLQPKYFFKFQKSLEHNAHGVLSSLILYKLLIYFLESDFSTNEDYIFDHEDARQFYIRREILRSMASHTCHDVYQNSMLSFSFLLILCDDAQEWGRKSIADLYVSKDFKYEYKDIDIKLNNAPFMCHFLDKYIIKGYDSAETILKNFHRQSKTYVRVFRDGQDTKSRNFNFLRQTQIEVKEGTSDRLYYVTLKVTADEQAQIVIKRQHPVEFEDDNMFIQICDKVFVGSTSSKDRETVIYELSL